MPLPKPKKNEKQNDFMGRCLKDKEIEKFKKQPQRVAVCMGQWEEGPEEEEESET
jgi:phosphopantetheinyl transferase (holo-ACP synthase)